MNPVLVVTVGLRSGKIYRATVCARHRKDTVYNDHIDHARGLLAAVHVASLEIHPSVQVLPPYERVGEEGSD